MTHNISPGTATTEQHMVPPPAVMSPDEVASARVGAVELVSNVRATSGSRQLDAIDEVANVGVVAQRNAGRQLELVKTRIAVLLDQGGASQSVSNDLAGLRSALDQIDPTFGANQTWRKTIGKLPVVRHRIVRQALTKIALRYETVAHQVTVIEARLRDGRTLLMRDNVELRQLYEDVEVQHEAVVRQRFVAQLLFTELERLVGEVDDPMERDRIQAALHDVAIRVQDLGAMQEVHLQFFVSIDLARQNNSRLAHAVERTLTMATNVVTIGLAIQAALVRQRRVQEATERTRQFLGSMVEHNAQAIRRQTEQIGNLYTDPVIAMDQLARAHGDLIAALDTARRLRDDGLVTARTNIAELDTLTREMAKQVDELQTIKSVAP